MMNVLLKQLGKMALTQATVEELLTRAAKLVIIRELTLDDWVYLSRLVVYRTTTRLHASDEQKASLARVLQRIEGQKDELGQKNELGSAFN